jgi:hypothetical protein
MFDQLGGLAIGVVVFALVVVIGSVVLTNLETAVGDTTAAGQNAEYALTQLGSTGLLGWLGAIIAIAIGALVIGYFISGFGKKTV